MCPWTGLWRSRWRRSWKCTVTMPRCCGAVNRPPPPWPCSGPSPRRMRRKIPWGCSVERTGLGPAHRSPGCCPHATVHTVPCPFVPGPHPRPQSFCRTLFPYNATKSQNMQTTDERWLERHTAISVEQVRHTARDQPASFFVSVLHPTSCVPPRSMQDTPHTAFASFAERKPRQVPSTASCGEGCGEDHREDSGSMAAMLCASGSPLPSASSDVIRRGCFLSGRTLRGPLTLGDGIRSR